ncbi:MAG: YwaF family protein [Clostridia bacterium]|nr:YwaF family protein [Clostridia bacterium]
MNIQFFNGWYFLFIFASIAGFIGLYFLLRRKSKKTIYIVLISLMVFALVLHFLKGLFPPYSENYETHLRDSWFINICGANIALFPFMMLSKNKHVKDYMFYIGVISGLLAICYPIDPIQKVNQSAEWIDILRYYLHHNLLWYTPLLMVILKIHTLDYRRVFSTPTIFLVVMLFIMLNQVFQSELGFIPPRGDDIFNVHYINNSLIWGPDGKLSKLIEWACPSIFKTIPVGVHAGEPKYWPWFWLVVPCYLLVTPICFLMSLIFDFKHFKQDFTLLLTKIKAFLTTLKGKSN